MISGASDDVFYEGERAFGLELSLTDGAGGFEHVLVPTALYSGYTLMIDVADLDGDGDGDVVAGHTGGLSLFFSDGATLATQVDLGGPRVGPVALGDVDADGDADLVALDDTGALGVWHNDGAGAFTLVQSVPTSGGAVFDSDWDSLDLLDLDDDGTVDVLVNLADYYAEPLYAFLGDGTGVFDDSAPYVSSLGVGRSVFSLDAGDLDGDGRVDLAFTCADETLLSLSFDGGFGASSSWPITSYGFNWVASGDIDGDGDVDVVGTAGFDVGVLLQDAGALVDTGAAYELTEISGWAVANDAFDLVDMNGDGCADLVTHIYAQGATILVATGPSCMGAVPATWGGAPASPGEDVGSDPEGGDDKHDKAIPMSGDAEAVGCSAVGGGVIEPGLVALSALVLIRRRRAARA